MIPSVGRIVHYTSLGGAAGLYPPETQAAIITKVVPLGTGLPDRGGWEEDDEAGYKISLHIFYETGQFDMQDVPFSHRPMIRGHWNWPPRA